MEQRKTPKFSSKTNALPITETFGLFTCVPYAAELARHIFQNAKSAIIFVIES